MSFLRGLPDRRSAAARRALDERRLDEAERLLLEITRDRPNSPADWWNLGLVYKFQGRWQDSLDAFLTNGKLHPAPEAYWNAGLAATALRDWSTARWAWKQLDFDVGPGDGPPEANFGASPVRLNPDDRDEVVWGLRIDPCRTRIKSIPLPESGHRFNDVVLHDVAPRGTRMLGDRELGVFDEIERMEAAPHPTMKAELSWATPDDERDLDARFAEHDAAGENWTSNVNMLCAKCDLSGPHRHDHDRDRGREEVRLTGTWGFGGDPDAIRSVLAAWAAAGPGRTAAPLEVAEPVQD